MCMDVQVQVEVSANSVVSIMQLWPVAVVHLVTAIIGLLWSLVTALSYSCQDDVATVWKKIFYNIYSDITTSEVKAQNEDKHMMLQTMFIIHIFLSLLDNYWSGIVPFTCCVRPDIKL